MRRLAAVLVAAVALGGCGGHRSATASLPLPVEVLVPDGLAREVATGFALEPGRAVTVAHVLDPQRVGARVEVRAPGGPVRAATVVAVDERDDLAELAVPGLAAPRAKLATTGAGGRVRLLVVRAGKMRALSARVRRRITARIRTPDGRRVARRPALELQADVLPGDSGAAVLTADGRVAGVVFARSNVRAHTAYAVAATAPRN
jgi:S1-C subfamily serine protease